MVYRITLSHPVKKMRQQALSASKKLRQSDEKVEFPWATWTKREIVFRLPNADGRRTDTIYRVEWRGSRSAVLISVPRGPGVGAWILDYIRTVITEAGWKIEREEGQDPAIPYKRLRWEFDCN